MPIEADKDSAHLLLLPHGLYYRHAQEIEDLENGEEQEISVIPVIVNPGNPVQQQDGIVVVVMGPHLYPDAYSDEVRQALRVASEHAVVEIRQAIEDAQFHERQGEQSGNSEGWEPVTVADLRDGDIVRKVESEHGTWCTHVEGAPGFLVNGLGPSAVTEYERRIYPAHG